MDNLAIELEDIQQILGNKTRTILQEQQNFLQALAARFPDMVRGRIEKNRSTLQVLTAKLPIIVGNLQERQQNLLNQLRQRMQVALDSRMAKETRFLELQEQFVRLASPDYLLKRGYSLTLRHGKIIKSVTGLNIGDTLTTRFSDGKIESVITDNK